MTWYFERLIFPAFSRRERTSIYLANRGIRTANVPLVPGIAIPHQLETIKKPLVVSLHATPERLIQVRQNRLLSIGAGVGNDSKSIPALASSACRLRLCEARINGCFPRQSVIP